MWSGTFRDCLPRCAPCALIVDRAGVTPGGAGRWIALTGALVGGLVLAIVLIPDFAAWTAHGALHHHHDG